MIRRYLQRNGGDLKKSANCFLAAVDLTTAVPTNELVAGFWIWQCASLEEAIEWVKRCPNPMYGESDIEIRQIFDAEDFGDELTPELREQEERLREKLAG